MGGGATGSTTCSEERSLDEREGPSGAHRTLAVVVALASPRALPIVTSVLPDVLGRLSRTATSAIVLVMQGLSGAP